MRRRYHNGAKHRNDVQLKDAVRISPMSSEVVRLRKGCPRTTLLTIAGLLLFHV
jgi:hypothetical protein